MTVAVPFRVVLRQHFDINPPIFVATLLTPESPTCSPAPQPHPPTPCLAPSEPPPPSQAVSSGTLTPLLPVPPDTATNSSPSPRKIPYRLSAPQKYRHRQRLKRVDEIIATVDAALKKQGTTIKNLERWKAEMPTEAEMLPRDKYTVFARYAKKYRKTVRSESGIFLSRLPWGDLFGGF